MSGTIFSSLMRSAIVGNRLEWTLAISFVISKIAI